MDQSPNQTGDDHDLINQEGVKDGWPRKSRGQKQIQKQERGGDDPEGTVSWIPKQFQTGLGCVPIDISHIEDFTKLAGHLGIRPDELGLDASLAEVSAHGEVCNGSDHGDGGRDVVEDSMWARLGEGQACEGEGGDKHHCADSLKRRQC